MKTSILALSACVAISTSFTSCSNPTANNTAIISTDSIKSSDTATRMYMTDIDNYRKQYDDSITANEKSINEFNVRIENEKQENREEYKKKSAELETKNSDMKRKLDEYKADGKSKWDAFKTGFNKDMADLGQSIKDLKNKI